jgi:hypothetical protein
MDDGLKREVERYNFVCDPVVWAILRVVQAQNDLAHAIDQVASYGAPAARHPPLGDRGPF